MSDTGSTSTIHSSSGQTRHSRGDFCAVLVLDGSGRVVAANESAQKLWQAAGTELIGELFVSLFVFEVVSRDPDFLQAQWDALLGNALHTETLLSAQVREDAARDVRVRLERQLGAAGFVATVQPTPAPAIAAAVPTTADVASHVRLLSEHGAAGFFDLNIAQARVHFSPTWKKLIGYTAAELPDTLETWHQLIHPDDSAAAPDKVGRKAAAGTRPFNVEFRMKHRLGHWVWTQCVGVQVVNADSELDRVTGVNLDITERKELEDALVANDARLQDLSAGGPLGVFELDFANQVFWFSPAFERLLGYQEGELASAPDSFAAVLLPDEASVGTEAWLLARAPGQSAFFEKLSLRTKEGGTVPVVFGAQRSLNRKRELVRVVGFVCPVPAGLADERDALPARTANGAFDALAEAVIITNAQGRIIFLNATAARLTRSSATMAQGQPLGDIFQLVNRKSGRGGIDPLDQALSADQPLPLSDDDALVAVGTATHHIAANNTVPIVWTARAIFGPEGKPQGVVVVFRNPDEMTLTPEELVKANRFESLGLLAGGIAHDFNNLLTTILGAVSLAKDTRDYSALGDAEKACMTAKGLTKQLLAVAKGESGLQTVCAPREILEDAIKIAAAGSEADITLHVSEETDAVLVDRAQLLQVFQNLIVNALEAMPPPPHRARLQIRAHNVSLDADQVPALAAGDYVEFEVRDNGSGISSEHVERIFDPFFTTKKHGTGLGLATVLSLVRKHGGQIGLDTQVGVGTAFTVYLPKADRAPDTQARPAASLRFGTGRILFMDDDPNITALTARMLDSLDYKYDLAKNGEEALALYRRYLNIGRPYDAVIMDLTVVGAMGGEECFTELRKLDPDVRAIVASGYDNEAIAQKFLDKGFCGYLTKPYRVIDLGKVLKTVLG